CFIKCIKERSREAEDIVDLMHLALEEANRYVYYLSKESEDYQGMGTTFVAATFCGNSLYCINVGDSRMYKLNRAGDHPMSLKKVTVDHSIVEMMIKEGMITEEEARVHPQKNMITRAIGIEETVEIDDFRLDVDRLVRVLLCSDGLSGMLTDLDILNIVSGKNDVEDTAARLVEKANEHGGRDNISVIVIDFTGEEVEHD
ncbi:MAG: serine/threonine-protein phosphatase, partial [Firmicutes bacterium]|nr:serine/threonine-protein phosphatase [Bacillota bacterium]